MQHTPFPRDFVTYKMRILYKLVLQGLMGHNITVFRHDFVINITSLEILIDCYFAQLRILLIEFCLL